MTREAEKRQRWTACALVVLGAISSPVQAVGGSIQVHMSPGQILFQASAPGGHASLRVGCSDGAYMETHTSGKEDLSFVPIRDDGVPFGHGRCKYELVVHPPIDRQAIDAAYQSGDERRLRELWEAAMKNMLVRDGSFELKGGLIVAPAELSAASAGRSTE